MKIQGTTENIHAYLSGQLTTEQVEAFEQWQNTSQGNADSVHELRQAWESALLYDSPPFDSKSAIDRMPFADRDIPIRKLKSRSGRWRLTRWAAAATVLAVSSWGLYQFSESPLKEANGTAVEFVNLEDGTDIYLDESGTVTFPESFSNNERLVMLDGSAYFNVAKETARQFVIETDFAKVVVLGTEFGVHEDDDAETVEVFVTGGKVRLQPNGSDTYIDVEAGESAIFEHKTGKLQRSKNADMNKVAWHTNNLLFAKTPISKVIRDLEATYDVTIDYTTSGITECTFSSLYDKVEVTQILEDMSVVFGFRVVSTKETHFEIKGGNCNPG